MNQPSMIKYLKRIVIFLSAGVMFGSGYLLIQVPNRAISHPLFKWLVIALVINLIAFVWLKVIDNKASLIKVKDPKPHSKK